MNYSRDRILIPALFPLAAAITIAAVALNFSRVLLVAGKNPAVVIGILVASGVLVGATYLSRRSRAMTAGVTLAVFGMGVALSVSGMVALGIEEERAESHEPGAESFDSEVTVTAFDIGFREKQLSTTPGKVKVIYANEGASHTLVIEGVPSLKKLEVKKKGDTDEDVVDLKAGVFTYFCDLAGHRGGGMEGTLTVK